MPTLQHQSGDEYTFAFAMTNKFPRKGKSNEVFTIICWNIELVKLRGLNIFFYSRRMRRTNIYFFMVFLKENWGLLNIVLGFTIGKLVIGILLFSSTWEISYKYSSMFPVDLRREGSKGNLEVSLTVEDVVVIIVFN